MPPCITKMVMLYDRWRQIAREHSDQLALCDLVFNQQWTFRQLAEQSERSARLDPPISYPQGITPDFVFAVLGAWREGQVVLPLEAGQKPFAIPHPPPGIVHLKTTSATTGDPRLVAFTAGQLIADARNIVETMGLRPEWPNLGVISFAHSYGFSNLVLPLLLYGIPLLLLDSPLPQAVRRAGDMYPEITLAAVPALWRAWHEAGAIPRSVRLAISAGAPLSLSLEEEIFQHMGLKIHTFYGATECGGIAYDATNTPRTNPTCVGAPLRNVSLAIAEDSCLEVTSSAVAETCWPEANPNVGGGRYHTSDLAELSAGQVFLGGRVSGQINVAGRKVSAEAIERTLLTHPVVRECLVFGVPSQDEARSEQIVASVAAKAPVSAESLRQFLLSRLPSWQVPREWWFVDSLAVNARGKLSRAEWRKRYLARRP